MISSEQYAVTAASQSSLFQLSMQLIENSLKVKTPQILLSTCSLFSSLLRKETLPFPLPLVQMTTIFNLSLKQMQRFFTAQLHIAQSKEIAVNDIENMPFEMKIFSCGLNVIYCFLQLTKQHQNSITVEEGFGCPVVEKLNKAPNAKNVHTDLSPILQSCILSLDEVFMPYCLQLSSKSFIGKYAWYQVIKVLSALYEIPSEDSLLFEFTRKLVTSHIFNHIWDIKVDEIFLSSCGLEKNTCTHCIKVFIEFCLKHNEVSESYIKEVLNGVDHLNCSLRDCAAVLSQKCDRDKTINSSNLYSSQITFLCLSYMCFLHNGKIVETHILMPHLICYITFNSESLTSLTMVPVVKHVSFILAMCMYENITKFETGLCEVSKIMWEIVSKVPSPENIYTHHKIMLWWCFRNGSLNDLSLFTLQTWLKFSVLNDNQSLSQHSTKTVLQLLCYSDSAQEEFVKQFEINPEISFTYLKKALLLEVNKENDFEKRFGDLINLLIQHIMASLIKLLIMKNKKERNNNDKLLYIGLECLIWCKEKNCHVNNEMNIKLVFHVTNFCCKNFTTNISVLVPCLNFLNISTKDSSSDSKVWHIITGNANISMFLIKCFTLHKQIELEALDLILSIIVHQVKFNLQCNTSIRLSLAQFFKWMNRSNTKLLAYELVHQLLIVEFKVMFVQINSLEMLPFKRSLTSTDLRLLSFYLQNAIILGDPNLDGIVFSSYIKLIEYITKIDPQLEQHIMVQPWLRVLLESKLEDINNSWCLFEKSFSFPLSNVALTGVIQQFSEKLISIHHQLDKNKIASIEKLYKGVYNNCIPISIKEELVKIVSAGNATSMETCEKEITLVSQVEELVTNYISSTFTDKQCI